MGNGWVVGRALTPEHKANISAAKKGVPMRPEVLDAHRAKMSEPEVRQRLSEAVKTSPRSQAASEARRKWSSQDERGWVRALARHGLTPEEGEALLDAHQGRCAICGEGNVRTRQDARTGRSARRLAIDHDHVNGRVRGMLCHPCNLAIGHLERLRRLGLVSRVEEYLR